MLISPTRPQGDAVSPSDDVLTFSATDVGNWLLQLSHLNTALFFHQQRLHDMSYTQLALKDGWTQLGSKQDIPQHGLPLSGTDDHLNGRSPSPTDGSVAVC